MPFTDQIHPWRKAVREQTGLSQLELILVLAVIGFVGSAAVTLANAITAKALGDTVAQATERLVQNLELGIGQTQSYYGLTAEVAIQRGLVPEELRYQGQAVSPWGSLTIEPTGALFNGVRLTFESVPPGQCVDLINRMAPLMTAVRVN